MFLTPFKNEAVEREYRHILEIAWTLKMHANLPLKFWGECVLTAMHIINRLPTPILSFKTPFECLFSKSLSFSHLQIFGCLAYATNVPRSNKFDNHAKKCNFIGYPVGQKA